MAFLRANLTPIGGQSTKGVAPQMWSYKTGDASATLDTSGYFNEVSTLLFVGDLILVVVPISGTPTSAGWHMVMSNASNVVDVSDITALTLTDTD